MNIKVVKKIVKELKQSLKLVCEDEKTLYSSFNRIVADKYIELNGLEGIKTYIKQKFPDIYNKKIDNVLKNINISPICDENFCNIEIFDLFFQYYNLDKFDYFKKTQFYTPQKLAKEICKKTLKSDTFDILEPACGSGALLREIYNALKQNNKQINITAYEIDERAIQSAQLSFILNAYEEFGEKTSLNIINEDFLLTDINKKFDCIIANPPFLYRKLMPKIYMNYLKSNFPLAKENLAYGFMGKCLKLLKPEAKMTFILPLNFFYLENTKILKNKIETDYEIFVDKDISFPNVEGSKLKPCVLYLKNALPQNKEKTQDKEFCLGDISTIVTGIQTGNNSKYIKHFKDIKKSEIAKSVTQKGKKWYPYLKGGGYKKWSGNDEYFIYFENNGEQLRKEKGSIIRNERYFDKEGITYSYYCENRFSARYKEKGTLFDIGGSCLFFENSPDLYYTLAFLNSSVGAYLLKKYNPTMSVQTSTLKQLPLIIENKTAIAKICKKAVELSKKTDKFFSSSKYFITPDFVKCSETSFQQSFLKSENKYISLVNKLENIENEINQSFEKIYKIKVEKYYDPKKISLKLLRKKMIMTFFEWLNAKNYEDVYNYICENYGKSKESDLLFIAKILDGKYFNNPKFVIEKNLKILYNKK